MFWYIYNLRINKMKTTPVDIKPFRELGNPAFAIDTPRDHISLGSLVLCVAKEQSGKTFFLSNLLYQLKQAKGLGVLHHFPIFRQFFHFHENPSSSVISGTFSRENRFPQKRQKRPKIAKHTKHEPLPKRDAIFATFP